ncbi:Sodium-dependent phosphate transporter 1 [Frankliniella fusca]|uniref:Phosphate transporter n=1 Tax=Frankliniella fusca TaxID=407009 RepID=A0AAE1HNV1_9NEOP|nr:Sodium-dependent phosphate transporter 1 [Frankliniella fusca]
MIEPYSPDVLWLIIVGFLVAFVLAFGIGANDVANSFGTSVGSKVLTVRQACILATIFEIAGSVLIGYKVSDTLRKDLLDLSMYEGDEYELLLGCLASLREYRAACVPACLPACLEAGGGMSSAVWLLLATFFKLPISGTHSIVGATVGFSLVCRGTQGLRWSTLGMIVLSWFISPVLSGVVSVAFFKMIEIFILRAPQPFKPALRAMPILYGFTVLVNVFSIVHNGPRLFYFDRIPLWGALLASLCVGLLVSIMVQVFLVPHQRKAILGSLDRSTKDRNRGVSFTFGGSTDSSRDPSPRPSRNVSAENLQNTVLPMIKEGNELSLPQNETSATSTSNAQQMYRFAGGNKTGKENGYSLAETTLNSALTESSDLTGDRQLGLPGSGQVTPAYGLSPNSSAVPLIREKVPESLKLMEQGGTAAVEEEPYEVAKTFSFLQILTAIFGSFAHGGNDVSNAIGPLIAMWLIYHDGSVRQASETPIYILLYGGLGISTGLWLWGRRVIQTVGEDLTKITATEGFTIEIGAAFTVLLASKIGIPISTTHCKVGSVVFVGLASSTSSGVDLRLFRNIIFAWLVTLPAAGGLSALSMFLFRSFLL